MPTPTPRAPTKPIPPTALTVSITGIDGKTYRVPPGAEQDWTNPKMWVVTDPDGRTYNTEDGKFYYDMGDGTYKKASQTWPGCDVTGHLLGRHGNIEVKEGGRW